MGTTSNSADGKIDEFLRKPTGEVTSVFHSPDIKVFAIKTLSKSQPNVLESLIPAEIGALITLQIHESMGMGHNFLHL